MENRAWGRAESQICQSSSLVIPAQAGIHELILSENLSLLTPAFAGVTEIVNLHLPFTFFTRKKT